MEKLFETIKNWIYINVIKNWKTTLSGAFVLVMMYSVWRGWMTMEDAEKMIYIAVAYGFIISKDGNKTGIMPR